MNDVAKSEPSIGALIGSLVSETGTLVRQELNLASTEMGEKAKRGASNLGSVLLGGAVVQVGLLSLIAAVIMGLQPFVPMWISALAIGVIVGGTGYSLLRKGLKGLGEIDAVPHRTVDSLQQDKTWMKEQLR